MSAVKNLRAMFENKGDASPADDDRGRSLGVSTPSPTPGARSGSPKPLVNKVRSSFVAVERNGVIGLVREDSLSRTSTPRGSLDIDREAISKAKIDKPPKSPKSPMSPAFLASLNSAMSQISVRSARASLEFQQEQEGLPGAVTDKPSHNPDKILDEETPTGVLSPADPTTATAEPAVKSAPESVAESAPESATESAPESAPAKKPEPEQAAPKETAAPTSSTDSVSQKSDKSTKPAAAATKAVAKPAATKTTATKTAATKTTATKTAATKTAAAPAPKAAAAKATPKPAAATATKAATDSSRRANARPLQKTVEATARRSTSAVRSSSAARSTSAVRSSSAVRPGSAARPASAAKTGAATGAAKRPQPIKIDSGAAVPKPKTRSPTKPVGLPASLTAPTASSVSKTGAGAASGATQSRPTNSRQSLGPLGGQVPGHVVHGAKTAKQESALRAAKERSAARSRPSIGPPPAKSAKEAPKKTKDVDEGFLARMTRPTQASSSKTAGETTPPKQCGSRPSTAGTAASGGSHYEGSPTRKSSPRKSIGKKSPSPSLSEKSVTKPKEEAVEEPVKDVAQEETAPVKAEEPEPLPVEEAAAETANVETAEEVVAIAEDAELTQATPEPVAEVAEVAETKVEETPAAEPVVESEPVAEPEAAVAVEEAPVEPATEATEEPKAEEVAEPVAEPVVLETSDKADETAVQASS